MPAYSRQGSEWTNTIMRQRGADWSANDALGFVRVGSEWVPFQAPVGDNLGQPISLAATPGDLEATITWTNNLAAGVDATTVRVQFRLPETTPVWTEMTYPITAAIFEYLNEATTYQFQVRYITRDPDDGQISATGPISELFFTTLALSGPGTPAADPGGTGPDTIWPWGDTGGTPGAVGSGGCWWEYKIQVPELPLGVGVVSYVDSAPLITGEFAGDAGSLQLDLIAEGLACGDQFRIAYREVCNSVPGAWQYSLPNFVPCDWTASCGGIPDSGAWAIAPFTDAILALPQVCLEDDLEVIEDFITKQNYGRLPGLYQPVYTDSQWELRGKLSNASTGTPMIGGYNSNLANLTSASDFSMSVDLYVSSAPPNGPGTFGFVSHRIGGDIEFRVAPEGAGWKGYVAYSTQNGLRQVVTGTTELALNEWHRVTVTIDGNGDTLLYIDGVEEDSVTPGSLPDWDGTNLLSTVEVMGNSLMRTKKVACWNRVLTPEEVLALEGYPYPYFINSSLVNIGAGLTTFAHTLPTGIQAGDFLAVFWKTGETASPVAGLGTPAAGWTLGGNDDGAAMWWKLADGTETTVTANWTGGSGATAAVMSLIYRNVDQTTPIEATVGFVASGASSTSIEASDTTPRCTTNGNTFTSYFEGMTYFGVNWVSNGASTLDTGATRQPNLLERKATGGTREWNHWSTEGITENGQLRNNKRARWTSASGYNASFQVCLRAPRTADWLAKTHVAWYDFSYQASSAAATLILNPTMDHLAGLVTVLLPANGSEGGGSRGIDTTDPDNTWLTEVSQKLYYGTHASGRQMQPRENTGYNLFVIANANTSAPISMSILRSSYTGREGDRRRFWFRNNQLVLGAIRTGTFDSATMTVATDGDITTEFQAYRTNSTAGNQSGQAIVARATVAGIGMLPTLTPNVSWSQHVISWVGINHSSESAPTRLTPTIVGTPTQVTGAAGARTINKPSGAAVGEILLMISHFQTGGRISANFPTGFEMLNGSSSGSGGVGEIEFYTKVVDGTEPASWTPTFSTNGLLAMIRVTNILPMTPHVLVFDTAGLLANPEPMPTATGFAPGIVIRSGAQQDATARDVAIDVGTKIIPNADSPWGTTVHIEVTGEVDADATVGAANFTMTPFVAVAPRNYVYVLSAQPT